MNNEMFEELLDSVHEAGAILRGRKKPPCRTMLGSRNIYHDPGLEVKAIRRYDPWRSQGTKLPTGIGF